MFWHAHHMLWLWNVDAFGQQMMAKPFHAEQQWSPPGLPIVLPTLSNCPA